MQAVPSPEEWLPEREVFQFRLISQSLRKRWTFCVPLSTLAELCPEEGLDPQDCFEAFRHKVYAAAERKAGQRDPVEQIVISADDVRMSEP